MKLSGERVLVMCRLGGKPVRTAIGTVVGERRGARAGVAGLCIAASAAAGRVPRRSASGERVAARRRSAQSSGLRLGFWASGRWAGWTPSCVEGCGTCSRPSTGFAGRAVGRIAEDRGPAGLDRRTAVGAGAVALMAKLVSQAQRLGTFTYLFPGRGGVPADGSACDRRGVPGARDDGGRVRSVAGFNILVKSRGSTVPRVPRVRGLWGSEGSGGSVAARRRAHAAELPAARGCGGADASSPVRLGGLTVRRPRWRGVGRRAALRPARHDLWRVNGSARRRMRRMRLTMAWSRWLKVTEMSLIAKGVSLRPEGCVEEHTFREGTLDREV